MQSVITYYKIIFELKNSLACVLPSILDVLFHLQLLIDLFEVSSQMVFHIYVLVFYFSNSVFYLRKRHILNAGLFFFVFGLVN